MQEVVSNLCDEAESKGVVSLLSKIPEFMSCPVFLFIVTMLFS